MLKLKRVEIQGFKSFADRSEMRFHGSGLAAIVGPNGCGKSNVSDAISWVLGEQSAKSLRGTNMQDVIFAGTKDRKPLGMASVTLTLVNPEAHAPVVVSDANPQNEPKHRQSPEEVTITRRLYRSGESEYLVNGKSARLRDIQDIFMGSGLGPESYAIIEQGRIGQILSNKPADRRAIIEEAAGITRFKTKRRLAEAKLEAAKGNLTRVYDILEEVSRQVGSLKRQAAKAKRYEELRGELLDNLKVALTGRYKTLEREATKLALDLNLSTTEYTRLSEATAEKQATRDALQQECFTVEEKLRESRKLLSDLRVEAERTRGRLESQTAQVSTIDQRVTRDEQETEMLAARLTEVEQEIATQTALLQDLDRQVGESRQKAAAAEQQRNALQNELRQRTQAIEQSRQGVLRLMEEASRLKNQLASAEAFMASIERDTARLQRDEEAATSEIARLDGARKTAADTVVELRQTLQSFTEARRDCETLIQNHRQAVNKIRQELDQARGEVNKTRARQDSLNDVLSHHSYATGSVKEILSAVQKQQAGDLKPLGVLADFVEADSGYEKAAEEFLQEELEFVVVDGWRQAESGIGFVRSRLQGKATFLLHHLDAPNTVETAPAEHEIRSNSGVAKKLTDVLKLNNGFHGHSLRILPRLANCYLVEDHATAQALAPQYPHAYFLLQDGISYHGLAVSGGKKTGSGPLAIKRELRELTSTLSAKQSYVDTLTQSLAKAEHEIQDLTTELERLRAEQQGKEKEIHAQEVEVRKLNDEFNRAQNLLSVAKRELARLLEQKTRAEQNREQAQQTLAQKEAAKSEQEANLSELQKQATDAEASVARINEEHAALRVELAGVEERRRAAQSNKSRAEQQQRETAGRRQNLLAEIHRLKENKARLEGENAQLTEAQTQLATDIQALETAVAAHVEQEQSSRASLALAEETLRQLRTDFQSVQEQKSHLEVELVKAQGELKYLDDTCQKDLQISVAELSAQTEVMPDDEALALAQTKAAELRVKIDNLGPVNPDALQEFEEAQQRYDFLAAQRQDLLDSIRDTEKTIHEIDTESRKRFADAFAHVNENFREMYKTLFNGGIGEMRLTDPDNVIESGIDILAQPPGKRLQNVLLLSGGEKALTAMALLMAIFKYQPSPFCILDEVDAPLDEPNTERLNRLIVEMSKETQFVVITHAKRTMEAAQVMYGVTMQEPGVSKLVSVKFNQMHDAPAAVVAPPTTAEPVAVQ